MPEYEDLPEAAIIDDFAHQETDRILSRTEKQIAKEYRQAEKELTAKIKKFGEQFDKKDEEMKQKMLDGKITKEQYSNWRVSMIATGDRWVAMRDTLAEDIARANDIAKSTINGHMEQVYSLNRNYSVYKVEKDSMIDTSYTLYNRRATEELFKNKKSLLPAPKPGSKAWKAAHDKDLRWNQQKINSSMIQGLLQGESIPQIAKRMREVVGMNKRAAIRNARTMTTNIENKGRDDAFKELRGKGIEMDTVWVSTLDGRTRHSHRLLHGEIRDEKTGKYSNKLRFPGDEQGAPEEVYNCRCCEISTIKGFPVNIPRWSPKMEGMTYEEWLGEHSPNKNVAEKATERYDFSAIFKKTKGLPGEFAEKMGDTLRKCKIPEAQDVYAKFADRLICEDYKSKKAYCSGKRIHFNADADAKGGDWQEPTQVAFHEFGHNIDNLILDDSRRSGKTYGWDHWGISDTEQNGKTLMSVLKEDMKNIKKMYGVKTNDEAIDKIDEEGLTRKQRCNLSDVLERFSSTSYPLGFGHGKSYHRTKGNTENEFFAEVLDSAVANPEAYETTKKYFPNSVDWVWSVVKGAINE